MKHKGKKIIHVCCALFVLFYLIIPLNKLNNNEKIPLTHEAQSISKENKTNANEPKKNPKIERITLIGVGDIMLARAVQAKMKKMNDFKWPLHLIEPYLKEADILFGNLETPIAEKGTESWEGNRFKADPKTIEGLIQVGFDFLSVANNHIGDQKREGMENTFRILQENAIEYVGGGFNEEEAHSAKIKIIKGLKIGFLGYTDIGASYTIAKEKQSGIAWAEIDRLKKDIEKSLENTDILIVSFHFGTEYQTHSNTRQQELARASIDSGADLVIGHHPHLPQEIEYYKNGIIVYSLGNFIFDQTWSKATMKGLTIKITIENEKIVDLKEIPIKISSQFQTELDI
ncbi:CapA family protein [Candidatus Peregrinibacteria bacterium]|nr:CapA family protein [Candidatus Peregrinibacteria bacterium]